MQFPLLLLFLHVMCVKSNAVSSIAPVSLRNVCQIQFHFLLFIWFSVDVWWVILHSSSFVILSVRFVLIIRLKHLFTNICGLLVIWLVVFQVSQAYNNNNANEICAMWKQKAAQVIPTVIRIIYRSNSKITIVESNKTQLAPQYIYTAAKICNSWHMFTCKEHFKLQIRPPSLILLITTSQDRWIFPAKTEKREFQ